LWAFYIFSLASNLYAVMTINFNAKANILLYIMVWVFCCRWSDFRKRSIATFILCHEDLFVKNFRICQLELKLSPKNPQKHPFLHHINLHINSVRLEYIFVLKKILMAQNKGCNWPVAKMDGLCFVCGNLLLFIWFWWSVWVWDNVKCCIYFVQK
jgi:hypothetical protein